jgi:hypothetical protein
MRVQQAKGPALRGLEDLFGDVANQSTAGGGPTARAGAGAGVGAGAGAGAVAVQTTVDARPHEWIEAFDTTRQKRYYYHSVTKETRWKPPPNV